MLKNLTRKERLKLNLLKVGEIANEVGVLRSTIDFYADINLIRVDDYTQCKYRLFKRDETLARIAEIKEMQGRGLTLEDIKKDMLSK